MVARNLYEAECCEQPDRSIRVSRGVETDAFIAEADRFLERFIDRVGGLASAATGVAR